MMGTRCKSQRTPVHIWSWGGNFYGQLGNNESGSGTDQTRAVAVVGPDGTGQLGNIVAIAAGYGHSLAVDKFGRVWAWGHNYYGQLGNELADTKQKKPIEMERPGSWEINLP